MNRLLKLILFAIVSIGVYFVLRFFVDERFENTVFMISLICFFVMNIFLEDKF
jgi:hypothetical protein